MWKTPLKANHSWEKPDLEKNRSIIRLACSFCPNIFQPDPENTFTFRLPVNKEYTLIRLAGDGGYQEMYGMCSDDDFQPFDRDGKIFQHIMFLVNALKDSPGKNELEELKNGYLKYEERPQENKKRVNAWMPLKGWEYSEQLSNADIQAWLCNLSFSTSYQLLEIIAYSDDTYRHTRSYLLLKWDEKENAVWKPINGNTDSIHDAFTENDLFLTMGNCLEYLRFFCWALEADKGNFILAQKNQDAPWSGNPDQKNWKHIHSILNHPAEVNEIDTGFKIKAPIVYGNVIYRSDFLIKSDGNVVMEDDTPLLQDLPFKTERFGSKYLRKLSQPTDDLTKGEKPLVFPDHIGTTIISEVRFLDRLSKEGLVYGLKLENDFLFASISVQSSVAKLKDRIVIENCKFDGYVRLVNHTMSTSIEFKNCMFTKGFFADNTSQHNTIIFNGCFFSKSKDAFSPVICLKNFNSQADLVFTNCKIMGRVLAENMKLSGDFILNGCLIAYSQLHTEVTFGDMNIPFLDSKDVDEELYIDKKQITLSSKKEVAYIGGEAVIYKIDEIIDGPILCLDNSVIKGDLKISLQTHPLLPKNNCTVIAGNLSAKGIEVRGDSNFFGAFVAGNMDLDNSHFNQNLNFSGYSWDRIQFRLTGKLDLMNCIISGSLMLSYAEIGGAISLYGIHVGNNINLFSTRCGDNLDLQYSEVKGEVRAMLKVHTLSDYIVTPQREILVIGKDILLSGASINAVKMGGIYVKGQIEARTGSFNSFAIKMGIKFDSNTQQFSPVQSRAFAISLTAIKVQGELDMSGIVVGQTSDLADKSQNRNDNKGCTIQSCLIGNNVLFFNKNSMMLLDKELKDLADQNIDIWDFVDEGSFGSGEKIKNYPSKIDEHLFLQDNIIGGQLDLRNVSVKGPIKLNDTSAGVVNINTFYEALITDKKIAGLETRYEKIDLSNINIRNWDLGLNNKEIPKAYDKMLDKTYPFEKAVYLSMEKELRNELEDRVADKIYVKMKNHIHKELIKVAENRKPSLARGLIILALSVIGLVTLRSRTDTPVLYFEFILSILVVSFLVLYFRWIRVLADWMYGAFAGYGTEMKRLLFLYLLCVLAIFLLLRYNCKTPEAILLTCRYVIPFVKDLFKESGTLVDVNFKLTIVFLTVLSNIFLTLGLYGFAENLIRKK